MRIRIRALLVFALASSLTISLGCASEADKTNDAATPSVLATDTPRPSNNNQASGPTAASLRPTLTEGPASGSYDRDGVKFSYPAYLRKTEAWGLDYNMVTLTNGNARIILTAYKPAALRLGAPELLTALKTAVQTYYRGAVFPYKSPKLVAIGDNKATQPNFRVLPPKPPQGVEVDSWAIEKPKEQPKDEDPETLYQRQRQQDWDGYANSRPDQYRRNENWMVEKSIWQFSKRTGPDGTVYDVALGMCYWEDQRHIVVLESGTGPNAVVHIIYFYPYTDYPLMSHAIAAFHASLTVGNQPQPAQPTQPTQPAQPSGTGT